MFSGISTTVKWIIIAVIIVIIIVVCILIYYSGKKDGKGAPAKQIDLPPGVDIPNGWTPRPVSVTLYNAMDGVGTDEDEIWNALEGLNDAQLALVYNDFNIYTKDQGSDEDLFSWFENDLSGDNLSRALNFFNGIV